jgi:hypothetical protein
VKYLKSRFSEKRIEKQKKFNVVDEGHPFYPVNHMKQNNTLYGQNAEF